MLVRVHASSVNGTDLRFRRGGIGLGRFQLPFTVGFDVAGEVVACGPKVTAFEPGDRVCALLGVRGGGAAEYVVVSQARVGLAPQTGSLVEAAALPLAGLTALQALRDAAGEHVRPGVRVLVNGASGGIGSFAVQLAKHFGAHVTGVASERKLDFVEDLGPDDVVARGTALTTLGRTWDVILDTVPVLKFSEVKAAIDEGGLLVNVGLIPTRPAELLAASGLTRPRFKTMHTKERGADLTFLSRLVDRGVLRVPLDRTFDLAHIADAHTYLENGDVKGKIVVTM